MRPIALAAALAAAVAAPRLAHADPPKKAAVGEVVVTATRLPAYLSDAPDVYVIDRRQIELRQATFAPDLLATVPGLAVTSEGGFGGFTAVRMRGATADKTLVLIDGVPQNDASDPSGAYDFAALDLADIERVEILSGPQSSLWGSDAIGGVISFTTRELDGWRAALEGGSLATFDGSAAVGRRTEAWALGANLSGYRSRGVSRADGLGAPDPFWTWTASGYARLTPAPFASFDLRLRYHQARAEIDGYDAVTGAFGDTPGQFNANRDWTGTARAKLEGPWGVQHTFSVGVFEIDRSDIYPGFAASSASYWASRQDYRWLAERGAPSDAVGLAFGVERESDHASISTGQRFDLGTTSGFALARWRPLAPLTLTGAIRYDAPDVFAGQATGRVGAVLKLGRGFSLESAWGQGFKTPTISEIACDFCFPAGPSAGLKPEHAQGEDVALAWRSGDGRFYAKVTGYRLDVQDQIAFAAAFPFRYINVGRTRSTGVEAQAQARLTRHLTLQAGYAYTDAVDLSAGTPELRVPPNAGSLALFWRDGRWQGALTARSESPDADINPSSFAPQVRPGFTLVGVSGAYALRPGLELTGRIENLTNAHYQEILGYGEPRLMVFLGLRAKG
ncbi:MAG TPA: TonB-dependent receptor [Caulobacteraceae bacterium]|nr:TonB-dependent receptor [Caulobacteraceae bacterium]